LKRHEANDRLAPPLIKPDERFSRIRLSEGASTAGLAPAVTVNLAAPETFSGVNIQVALAISSPVTGSFHAHPSAPPSLAAGFPVRQVFATTQDSDSSNGPHRLGGFTTLSGGLRRGRTAEGLPAYPVCPCCPVALADPAEILRRRLTVG
jgi:hypothetical protein